MIDALITGKIHGTPSRRTGPSGKPFAVCKVRAPLADNDAIFVSVITFSASAGNALLALTDGDSVSLAGSIVPKVWRPTNGEPKPAIDMVASAVLTLYQIDKKRKAAKPNEQPHVGAMDSYREAYAPLPEQDPHSPGDVRSISDFDRPFTNTP